MSAKKHSKSTTTFRMKAFKFDGARFSPTTILWPVFWDEESHWKALDKIGWHQLDGRFWRPESENCEIELYGHAPRSQRAEGYPEFDRYLVQTGIPDGFGLNVLVDSEPLVFDLLARWAPVFSAEYLAGSLKKTTGIIRKYFALSHGHYPEDDCRQCNPLCQEKNDVLKRTPANGATAFLREEIRTVGGNVYPAGTRAVVDNSYSGRFDLLDPETSEVLVRLVTVDQCDFE